MRRLSRAADAWMIGTSLRPSAEGYASEGIRALLDWAWATGRVRTCVASISPHNAPSLALIHSFGFRHVGEQIDEIDGLELVFERRLPLAPAGAAGPVRRV